MNLFFVVVVAHWYWSVEGLLVQCCVTWPQVAIWGFTFAVITEPRRGHGVFVFIRVGFILLNVDGDVWPSLVEPVLHECECDVLFLLLRRECRLFWNFYIFVASSRRSCWFSTVFKIKWGGEGCFEEVFDGRVWREELGFISHAMPHPLKEYIYIYIYLRRIQHVLTRTKKPSRCSFAYFVVVSALFCFWGFVLSRVHLTFSQPPSSKLASSAVEKKKARSSSPRSRHSWVSSSFFFSLLLKLWRDIF